jgi:hypothetical protein
MNETTTDREQSHHECRMTKESEFQIPNFRKGSAKAGLRIRRSSFVIPSTFVIRISSLSLASLRRLLQGYE